MHIYTRHGDDGRTLLLSGSRVWKDDPRVQTCGEVDELCSWLGVLAAHLPESRPELAVQVRQVQAELFVMGAAAQLAGKLDAHPEIHPVGVKECSAAVLTNAVAYLNRLADFLFMLGRFCNHLADTEENVIVSVDEGSCCNAKS